jgi:hypothetical protein
MGPHCARGIRHRNSCLCHHAVVLKSDDGIGHNWGIADFYSHCVADIAFSGRWPCAIVQPANKRFSCAPVFYWLCNQLVWMHQSGYHLYDASATPGAYRCYTLTTLFLSSPIDAAACVWQRCVAWFARDTIVTFVPASRERAAAVKPSFSFG